ncbi:hypothetical protein [Sphingobacterium siyangense]|uniref:hypothetical protein n=1 Tax=Sphingobacterium siyangense TaxID=459529 RepID=UPI0019669148|nr:hypothetical protein [Sphingobacterium siyangense]QRY55984.1 hypothetical protein JVX97_18365 [Sphingobacterium siyangense]
MEHLEAQNEIIELGNILVNQLKIGDSSDTLARWMAHYIAEKIIEAKNASLEDRERVNRECCQLILDLWSHRWKMTENHKPLKNFERILDIIQNIDPESRKSYFFDRNHYSSKNDDSFLAAATEIDKGARNCLEYVLSKAAHEAADQDDIKLLNVASKLGVGADVSTIQYLMDKYPGSIPISAFVSEKKMDSDHRVDYVKDCIAELENLEKHLKIVKNELEKDLIVLENDDEN